MQEDEEEEEGGRKKGRRGGKGAKLEKGEAEKLSALAHAMIAVLLNYEDSEGRNIAEPFVQLPSKRDLPDYYDMVYSSFFRSTLKVES